MIKANLHSHSQYCDGKATMEDMVNAAIKKNFSILGISSHAPVPIKNNFAIKNDQELMAYCREVRQLKSVHSDKAEIHCSLEIDYIPEITRSFTYFNDRCNLDYTIGSVHLVRNGSDDRLWFIDGPDAGIYDKGLREVFQGDIVKAVTAYYRQINEMITTQKPDMIGHVDKIKMHNRNRYFSEDEKWYIDLVEETLDYIKANDVVMEVNTRGLYKGRCDTLFPGEIILKKALKSGIPISLNSDAHHPSDLDGYYPEAMQLLEKIGFKEMYYYTKSEWKAYPFQ